MRSTRTQKLAACAALTGAALLVAACGEDSSTVTTSTVTVTAPSGTAAAPAPTDDTDAERDFSVGEFDALRLDAHYAVIVTIGDPVSVRAQGNSSALDLLDIRTEGKTLVAGAKPNVQWPPNTHVTVYVTTPTLSAADINGSGDIHIGRLQADSLSLGVKGSGEIEAPDLALSRLRITSAGSGGIEAGGTAEDADIRLSGSGEAELTTLTVKRAEVSVTGSGSVELTAIERVSGSVAGSGGVRVTGGATCSVSSVGSGKVTCD